MKLKRWALGLTALSCGMAAWAQSPSPTLPDTQVGQATQAAPQVQSLTALAAQRMRERAALATPMTPETEAQRQASLEQARKALDQGRSADALAHLDTAAALSHAADTEMLIVQAQLQQGEFRPGLSFASHAAGAHLYEPQALRLYAWLLALGEQSSFAQRLLSEGLRRMPDEPGLLALQTQLSRLNAKAEAESSSALAAARPGPWLVAGQEPPIKAEALQLLASGLLIDEGRTALVPMSTLATAEPSAQLWVCNGLGFGSKAQLRERFPELGLALLSLEQALPQGKTSRALSLAPRDAFAGSVASAFSHLGSPQAAPAWPAMHSGFLGRTSATDPTKQALGIALPQASAGGPVFDQSGRWIGLVMPGATPAAEPSLLPSRQLAEKIPALAQLPTQPLTAKLGSEQIYEQALPLTLQLFALKP